MHGVLRPEPVINRVGIGSNLGTEQVIWIEALTIFIVSHLTSPLSPFAGMVSAMGPGLCSREPLLDRRGWLRTYRHQDARKERQELFHGLEMRGRARDYMLDPASTARLHEFRLRAKLHDKCPAGHEHGLLLLHEGILLYWLRNIYSLCVL